MPQQLRATMDFQVGQAIVNGRNFIGVLQSMLTALTQVEAVANRVTTVLRGMASATQGNLSQLTTVTNTINTNVNTVNNTVNTYNQNIAAANRGTQGFATTVASWVGRFVALETANRLISDYIGKLEEATRLQRKLSGEQLDRATATQEVVNNVPAWAGSPDGERKAQQAIRRVMERSGTTYEQAANALATTAGSAGKDISVRAGEDYASSLAQLVRREGLDDSATLAVTKVLQQRGQDTPEGMQLAFAKGLQLQAVTPGVKKAPFWRGLAAATAGGIARDIDSDTLDSIYSAMVGQGISEQDAANQTRMIITLSQGTNVKGRHFLARQAEKLGVIPPGRFTAADIPGMAGTDKAAAKLLREQTDISADQVDIDADAAAPGPPRQTPAAKANRARDIDARRRHLDERRESLRIAREEYVTKQNEAQLDTDFMKVSPKDRLERVALPTFFGATTDEARNTIVQSVGGMFSRTDAAFKLASGAGQHAYQTARAALARARPEDTARANEIFEGTTRGQLTRQESQSEVEDIAAQGPGTNYAELLLRNATRTRDRLAAQGEYVPDSTTDTMAKVTSFASNPSKQVAEIGWKQLLADAYAEYTANPNPETFRIYQRIRAEAENPLNFFGSSSMLTLQRLAIALGSVRDTNRRSKRVADETSANVQAETTGAGFFPSGGDAQAAVQTAPMGMDGPRRAPVINFNYSVGTHVTGQGYHFDLDGPLDGLPGR